MSYLIGTDPELFVTKGGILQSAFGLIKGDKANPFVVDNGAVQVDGMALEFNTDPTDCEDTFVSHLSTVMKQLKEMVPDYEFFLEPTAEFGKDYIEEQPLAARELGCDPDYNAYTGKVNKKPDGDGGFRTASGHIHIGWTEGEDVNCPFHFDECCSVAKQLDAYLGIPSLLFDADEKRRQMYGQAGAFRPKPYGMEYRVLSNAWLKTEELQRWVFSNAQLAMDRLVAGEALEIDTQYFINRGVADKKTPRALTRMLLRHDIDLPPLEKVKEVEENKRDYGEIKAFFANYGEAMEAVLEPHIRNPFEMPLDRNVLRNAPRLAIRDDVLEVDQGEWRNNMGAREA